jgi:hypothetical protein
MNLLGAVFRELVGLFVDDGWLALDRYLQSVSSPRRRSLTGGPRKRLLSRATAVNAHRVRQ